MEENKTNLNNLEADKARRTDLLNEMNKLKFNNVNVSSKENSRDEQLVNSSYEDSNVQTKGTSDSIESKIKNEVVFPYDEEQVNEVKKDMKDESNDKPKIVEEISANNEPPKTPETKVEQPVRDKVGPSYFSGKMLDLMGWTCLRYALAVIAPFAPWGECFLIKYKLNKTFLSGKSLEFDGDGSELFVEYFKWIFLTLVTFGIHGLWVPIKKMKWVVSKIRFEGESFDKTESYFCGSMLRLLGINILCAFLTLISFGLLFPLAECIKLRWLAKNTIINDKMIRFEGRTLSLYGKYIKWIFLTLITIGIYGLWIPVKKLSWEVENTRVLN